MAANMYRVGDYVFFETSSTAPFQIRRIEELNKTPNGNVEAKVMCFYRRRDISSSLIMLADKHQSALEEEQEGEPEPLGEKQRHQLKHRELFLSRQVETLPATHIRGKCVVTLLNETESLLSYLQKEDTFFYSLVYDPQQKTLLADKGEIRVGQRYQAEITALLREEESDGRNLEELETLVWEPESGLIDKQIDQFLVIARSVGTFARALDCSSSVKQPSLHMSAAAASRDVTLFHAMDTLHKHTYDIAKAIASLVPPGGPVLCRDEMEEWSASEANLFEEALEKYGKDFNDIRQDFLPWKSLKNIIEYYYMWKTTDRYVQQKRVKAVEAESKLKQVYIPNYNKPNPAAIANNKPGVVNGKEGEEPASGRACESCYARSSHQWYSWGPAHMQCRLCASCWIYWKKYGGLKMPTRLERLAAHMASHRPHRCTISGCGKEFKLKAHLARHCATAHGLAIREGSPRPIMKTRAAFYLNATLLTRISRRICKDILRPRHAARNPFQPINIVAIKTECQAKLPDALKTLGRPKPKKRCNLAVISERLGVAMKTERADWLVRSDKSAYPEPERLAFQPPPRGEDGRFILPIRRSSEEYYKSETSSKLTPGINNVSPTILRKRGYEHHNGMDGPSPKRPMKMQMGVIRQVGGDSLDLYSSQRIPQSIMNRTSVINHHGLNGKSKTGLTKLNRKQGINWVDAPDDVYFQAIDSTRKLRKHFTSVELRRAARRPWRRITNKNHPSSELEPIVILD